jgi:hypothetical protein
VRQGAPEDVRRQVPALRSAERAHGDEPIVPIRGANRRGQILTAFLESDDEVIASGFGQVENQKSLGEYSAKVHMVFGLTFKSQIQPVSSRHEQVQAQTEGLQTISVR